MEPIGGPEKVPDDHYAGPDCRCLHCQVVEKAREVKTEKDIEAGDVITDGCGSEILAICPMCNKKTMQVIRPGKFQCSECDWMSYKQNCKREGCRQWFHYCYNCGYDEELHPLSKGYCSDECLKIAEPEKAWKKDES